MSITIESLLAIGILNDIFVSDAKTENTEIVKILLEDGRFNPSTRHNYPIK